MRITLDLDEETTQRVLALAKERDLTIEQLVAQLVEEARHERPGDAFIRLANAFPGNPDPNWRFNREECWERVHRWR